MASMSNELKDLFRNLYGYILESTAIGPHEKAIKIVEHLYSPEGNVALRQTTGRLTLAQFTGVSERAAARVLHRARTGTKTATVELRGAIDMDDFIEKNDVTLQVRKGIEKLEGKLISDIGFRDALGISPQVWPQMRDRDEFRLYQITVRKVLYWAQPDTIDKVRAKLDYL